MSSSRSVVDISDRLLDESLTCLFDRRIRDGLSAIESVSGILADLDPESLRVQRFTGRLALWVDAGYVSAEQLSLLLEKFPEDITRWLRGPAQACVRFALAVLDFVSGNAASAAKRLQRLLESENIDAPDAPMMIHFLLSRCWQRDCHYDLAMGDALTALQMAQDAGHAKMAAVISVTIAWLQIQAGRRDEARTLLDDARKVLAQSDDCISMGKIESCQGRISRRVGQHWEACRYFERSLDYCRQWPEPKRYIARWSVNLASEQRLLALALEREFDHKAQSAQKQLLIEREFMDIFSECSTFVNNLVKYDATLALQWESVSVKKFAHDAIAALALRRADQTSRRMRNENLTKISDLRKESRRNLSVARDLYQALGYTRGLSTVALVGGYLALDEAQVADAAVYANEAYTLAAPKDPLDMARARLLNCMIAHQKAEQEDDCKVAHTIILYALQAVSEAAELIRGTQHERLKGKISLCLGLSHARLGNLDEARKFQVEAELKLRPPSKDYVRHDLNVLREALSDSRAAESELERIVRLVSDDASTNRKSLHHEFDKIVVKKVWQQERNVDRVVKRLKMNRQKVVKILRELDLN